MSSLLVMQEMFPKLPEIWSVSYYFYILKFNIIRLMIRRILFQLYYMQHTKLSLFLLSLFFGKSIWLAKLNLVPISKYYYLCFKFNCSVLVFYLNFIFIIRYYSFKVIMESRLSLFSKRPDCILYGNLRTLKNPRILA